MIHDGSLKALLSRDREFIRSREESGAHDEFITPVEYRAGVKRPEPISFFYCMHTSVESSPSSKIEMIDEVTEVLLERVSRDGSFRLHIIFGWIKRETRKLISSVEIVGMKPFIAVFCPYAAYSRTLSM